MRVQRVVLYVAAIACLAMTAAGQPATIINGGFESAFTGWENRGDVQISTERPHSGVKHASFGLSKGNQSGTLRQTVWISNAAIEPTLSFWLLVTSKRTDPIAEEKLSVDILGTTGNLFETLAVFSNLNKGSDYAQYSFSLARYTGRAIVIQFRGACRNADKTAFRLDDVSIITTTVAATSINGTVTDGSGKPIAGAMVTFGAVSVTTNGSGNYVFQNVVCQTAALRVTKSGFSIWQENYTPACGVNNVRNVRLTAIQPMTVLRGVVTNIVDGKPIASAAITFNGVTVITNASGGYQFTGVDCRPSTLGASASKYQRWEEVFTPLCGKENKRDIVLTPIGVTSIEGIVFDQLTRLPVPKAKVGFNGQSITTDNDGRYRFFLMCPQGKVLGSHPIVVNKAGYKTYDQMHKPVCGTTNKNDIPFRPWVTRGHVYDKTTWKPLVGVTMTWGTAIAITNSEGFYSFPVLCQSATLTARKDGFQSVSQTIKALCPLVGDGYVADILLPATATHIFVNVVNPLAGNNPLPFASVQWGAFATTGQENRGYGLYNVPCQTAVLTVSLPYFQTVEQNYTPPKCGGSNVLTISMMRSESDITGQVTNRVTQQPLAGAAVRWGTHTATTDKSGRFVFALASCGTDTLTISMPGFETLAGKVASDCQRWSSFQVFPLQPVTTP